MCLLPTHPQITPQTNKILFCQCTMLVARDHFLFAISNSHIKLLISITNSATGLKPNWQTDLCYTSSRLLKSVKFQFIIFLVQLRTSRHSNGVVFHSRALFLFTLNSFLRKGYPFRSRAHFPDLNSLVSISYTLIHCNPWTPIPQILSYLNIHLLHNSIFMSSIKAFD